MSFSKTLASIAGIVFLLVGAVLLAGCPRPGSEGPGSQDKQADKKDADEMDLPEKIPSVVRGKEIYLRHCAACHGAFGAGDGPTAAELEPKPQAFTDKSFVRRHTPSSFYRVITNGEGKMPSYKETLSAQDRWDVTFYARTFATSAENIAKGEEIYVKNCAACHGATGKGDGQAGTELKKKPANFTDIEFMITEKSSEFQKAIIEGRESMPSFVGPIPDEDVWHTIDYVWTFAHE